MRYFFLETLGVIIPNFAVRIFRLDGGSAQLALSGSDHLVLHWDDSVASDLGPYLKLGVLVPQIRDFIVEQSDHFFCNLWVELLLSLIHGYRRGDGEWRTRSKGALTQSPIEQRSGFM